MKIDISSLKTGVRRSIHCQEKISATSIEEKDLKFADNSCIDVNFILKNVGAVIKMSGWLEAHLILNCSRCLVDYAYPVRVDIEEDFYEEMNGDDRFPEEKQLSENELRSVHYQGNIIDLSDTIREHILLNVPIRSICNEMCKGICSQCGVVLNDVQCDCKNDTIDLRLEALKKLLPTDSKHE